MRSPLPFSSSSRTLRQLPPAAAGETFPGQRRARNLLGAGCLPGGGGGGGSVSGTGWSEAAAALARGRGRGSGSLARLRRGSLGAASAPQPGAPETPAAAAAARPPAGPTSQPPLRPSLSPALPPLPKPPPRQSPVAAATAAVAAAEKARLPRRAAPRRLPASVPACGAASGLCSGALGPPSAPLWSFTPCPPSRSAPSLRLNSEDPLGKWGEWHATPEVFIPGNLSRWPP